MIGGDNRAKHIPAKQKRALENKLSERARSSSSLRPARFLASAANRDFESNLSIDFHEDLNLSPNSILPLFCECVVPCIRCALRNINPCDG